MTNDFSIYIDPSVLETWNVNINKKNNELINTLNDLEKKLNEFPDYMRGMYANSYYSSFKSLIDAHKITHDNMKDVSKFLLDLSLDMKNQ